MPESAKSPEQKIANEALEQLNNLGITPETMEGSVLDIGADDAVLAKHFSQKSSVNITSIDTVVTSETEALVDKGDARNLPYEDDVFDVVIAHASVPNVFMMMYSPEQPEISTESIENSVNKVFHEMIRVLKPGKVAYVSPLLFSENYESQRVFKKVVLAEIDSLKGEGVEVKLEFLDTIVNPENGEETERYKLLLRKVAST